MSKTGSGRIIVLSDVTFDERPGGSERLAALVVEALVRQGMCVEVVAGSTRGTSHWQQGPTLHRRFPVRARHHTVLCWDAWRGASAWSGALNGETVIAFHPSSALGCIMGSRGRANVVQFFFAPTHREWLYHTHGTAGSLPARLLVASALRETQRKALGASRLVLVLGRYSAKLLAGAFPGVKHVAEVRPAVDTERFSFAPTTHEARRSLGLDPGETMLLCVRRLVPRTGVLGLVNAFARFGSRGRRLVVVGDGPERARIEASVRELGLGDSVSLVGRVPDDQLPRYYRAADLSVVPSIGLEAFGLVVLESLASGTPVVTTPVGEAPAIVAGIDPRFVLPGTAPSEIACGLQSVLDVFRLRNLRARSRRFVEERYTLDHMGRRLCAVTRGLVSGPHCA